MVGEIVKKASFSTNGYFEEIDEVENEHGYQKFLNFVLKYADSFCLSIYMNEMFRDMDDFRKTKWGYLYNSILDYEYTCESPVTIGSEVMIIYFKIDQITTKFLTEKKMIYDFRDCVHIKESYNWLWDLAFLKDNKVFFISCTHEQFCSIDGNVLKLYHNQ
ncbi:MAG: hypothetical protein K0S41_4275 [Anaerocolumna sp.]|nr:hypothetical protein [Anaerocolumna sp.]